MKLLKLLNLLSKKKSEDELVSIIMPARNADKYISQAIDSVIKQSYQHWELNIVNDASSDKTKEIIDEYAQKDSRIKVFNNQTQQGIPKTRNIALSNSKGNVIGHLDADDILKPKAIEKTIAQFDEKTALVYSGYIFLDKYCKQTGKFMAQKFDLKKIKELGWQHFGMYKKSAAISVGGFNEKLITCSDGDLFMKIAQKYECKRVRKYLYYYRIHDTNIGYKRPFCSVCDKQKVCEYYKIQS